MTLEQMFALGHVLLALVSLAAGAISAWSSLSTKAALRELELKLRDREDDLKQWVESSFARRIAPALLLLLLMPLVAQASQVVDTVRDAAGRTATGILYLSWPSFAGATGQIVAAGTLTYRVNGGIVNVKLEPTVGGTIAQAGAIGVPLYTALFTGTTAGAISFAESWSIPQSGTPLTISQVLYTPPSGPSSPSVTPAATLSGWETPSGTINGTNAAFTLAHTPNSNYAGATTVIKNGLVLALGGDFTLSARTITFVTGAIPQSGDRLLTSYWY